MRAIAEFVDLVAVAQAWPPPDAVYGDRGLYLQVYAAKCHIADPLLMEALRYTFVDHVLDGELCSLKSSTRPQTENPYGSYRHSKPAAG